MTHAEFNEYVKTLAEYYTDSGHSNFGEYAVEVADGSEHCIYTGKAWDLVSEIRFTDSGLFDEAEENLLSYGETFESTDQHMTRLAAEIIYLAVIEALYALEEELA